MTERPNSSRYLCALFGVNSGTDSQLHQMFNNLMSLDPMDKNGPMSGRCEKQTDQMESFLAQNFGFQNIRGKQIVDGVKSFRLNKPPQDMRPDTKIYFPFNHPDSFVMSIGEILEWQCSYRVYADKDIPGMSKEFLQRALQGRSGNGEEAFRMKFVVRISTCPILMEFDAKVIPRDLNDTWPHRIKLVSVTGIDFAGRKHDVGDILYYVSNWKDIYEIDQNLGLPLVYNGRDFRPKVRQPQGQINRESVLESLKRMVKLRLYACDAEGVQIVVETGIGLGVFAGSLIGIDAEIRQLSATAIRKVLQNHAKSFNSIRAIVLALPIFSSGRADRFISNTFEDFANEFQKSSYNGPIPVFIADQDMHRLTVAIARMGFIVSELNPADSHGVFGEYWQNRGPAVEEKLALTTVGLLVQHHLINQEVLNYHNYNCVNISGEFRLPMNYNLMNAYEEASTSSFCTLL